MCEANHLDCDTKSVCLESQVLGSSLSLAVRAALLETFMGLKLHFVTRLGDAQGTSVSTFHFRASVLAWVI